MSGSGEDSLTDPGSSLPVGASRSGAAFLLVDDNPVFLELLGSFIRRYYPDAEITQASSGEEALTRLTTARFDVLLLDYRLPDFDGIEVLAIRKRLVDIAVVMVTGEGDERLAADIFRMGAYDYLVKSSIDPAGLRRCLDQVLMRRVLETQIAEKSDELVASSRELSQRTRALDTAYEKVRVKKEELRRLSDSLEQAVAMRTAELAATTRFLNEVLDSTTDHFIVAAGEDGTILTFNRGAEAAFGRPSGDVVGQVLFSELFEEYATDAAAARELVRACLEAGSQHRELQAIGEGGRRFPAHVTVSRFAGEGDQEGLVVLGRDITHERELERKNQAYVQQIEMANEDLRRKNEEILAATRLKSEFIANVSHELRTPLNAIIGYADLLRGGIYGPLAPRQSPAIEGIGVRAKDLLALINDILDLAKVESGKMDLRVSHFPLDQLVEGVIETGRVLAVDKEVSVTWEAEETGLVLRTDRQKLQQLLLNLVNNAVKFTPQGFVRVCTRTLAEGEIEFTVQDSGIGIDADELPNIFDEFRQVDGTSTREYGGTGLGLAISHKFAGHLGGELSVESRPGTGSTFRVVIPSRLARQESAGDIPITLDPYYRSDTSLKD